MTLSSLLTLLLTAASGDTHCRFALSWSEETFPDHPQLGAAQHGSRSPSRATCPLSLRPRCMGHTASVAPGFLCSSASVLLLGDEL